MSYQRMKIVINWHDWNYKIDYGDTLCNRDCTKGAHDKEKSFCFKFQKCQCTNN